MANTVTTVDIDATSLRLLQVRDNRVERWASATLEVNGNANGSMPDPAVLEETIRRLMKASGMKKGKVISSLTGLYSIFRLMTLPAQQAGASGVTQFIEEALPGEDMRLQWQLLEPDAALGQRVLVLGAPTDVVGAHMETLKSADLLPNTLELKGMALSRVVGKSNALIAQVEATSMDLVLVADGVPQMMRTVAIPSDLSGAEKGRQVAQALGQMAAFHNTRGHSSPLFPDTPAFIVGPHADEEGLVSTAQRQLDYPYQELAPAAEYPPSLPVAEYSVNLGLAMREQSKSSQQQEGAPIRLYMNLVPPKGAALKLTPARLAAMAASAAAIVVITLLFNLVLSAQEETAILEARLDPIVQQVNLRRAELGRVSQMETGIKEFQDLTAPWGHMTENVELLRGAVTEGVSVTQITIDANTVGFLAGAETIDQAIDFVEALRATERYKAVPYPRTSTSISANLTLVE